jgi:hypothetical protein
MSNERLPYLLLFVTAVLAIHSAPLIAEQQCLKKAWAAKSAQNYDAAIQAADSCIHRFANAAKHKEEELRNVPLLGTGSLPPADRSKALTQGILNDVAAACIVKGESAEALAQNHTADAALKEDFKKVAIGAYEAALAYKHARVLDPGPPETFWSPCEAAADHLQDLTGEDRSKLCR